MKRPNTVQGLTDLGRVRLSKSFFMRDFLYSDIAAIHGLSNIPDAPDLAIQIGTRLCEHILEPLQDAFGRIVIRSASCSVEVNGLRNTMMRNGVHRCPVVLGCIPEGWRLAEARVVDSRSPSNAVKKDIM